MAGTYYGLSGVGRQGWRDMARYGTVGPWHGRDGGKSWDGVPREHGMAQDDGTGHNMACHGAARDDEHDMARNGTELTLARLDSA